MKMKVVILSLVLSLVSVFAHAKNVKPVADSETTQLLTAITGIREIPMGNYTVRVLKFDAFSEPGSFYKLAITQDAGFDPAEAHSALYDLSRLLGEGYKIQSAMSLLPIKSQIFIRAYSAQHSSYKSLTLDVDGLKISVIDDK